MRSSTKPGVCCPCGFHSNAQATFWAKASPATRATSVRATRQTRLIGGTPGLKKPLEGSGSAPIGNRKKSPSEWAVGDHQGMRASPGKGDACQPVVSLAIKSQETRRIARKTKGGAGNGWSPREHVGQPKRQRAISPSTPVCSLSLWFAIEKPCNLHVVPLHNNLPRPLP